MFALRFGMAFLMAVGRHPIFVMRCQCAVRSLLLLTSVTAHGLLRARTHLGLAVLTPALLVHLLVVSLRQMACLQEHLPHLYFQLRMVAWS